MRFSFFIFITLLPKWLFAQICPGEIPKRHMVTLQYTAPIKHPGMGPFYNDDWSLLTSHSNSRRYRQPSFNLKYSFLYKRNLQIGLKAGGSLRSFKEEGVDNQDPQTATYTSSYNQWSWQLSPFINLNEKIGRILIGGGIGLSAVRFGKGNQFYKQYSYMNQDINSFSDLETTTTICGGWGLGLNAFISAGYKLSESFSCSISIDSYLHYLIFKGNVSKISVDQNHTQINSYNTSKTAEIYHENLKQISFSQLIPALNLNYHF